MNWTDKIQVYNEDCMETMSRYDDNYFDLAIVDPPYGIGESKKNNAARSNPMKGSKRIIKSKEYKIKDWDNSAPNVEYFAELKRVSKNQIIFGANHFVQNIPFANSSSW